MSTTSKGNRAEQELCRKLREFGFDPVKARMSKGRWDRGMEPGGDFDALLAWMEQCGLTRLRSYVTYIHKWHWDITSNNTRGRIKKLVTDPAPPKDGGILAVRYDGKGGKPARWRFWIAG